MSTATATRSRYAAAWAVLLGSLLILAGSGIVVVVGPARLEALVGPWVAFMALQLVVFALLVAAGYREQRAYWSAPIPVTIVVAQVVAGLCAVLVGGAADHLEPAPADVLF